MLAHYFSSVTIDFVMMSNYHNVMTDQMDDYVSCILVVTSGEPL